MVAELNLWETHWLNNTSCHQDNISSTLKIINLKSLDNVKVCLRILGMLPVTSYMCDQSFSSMWRLKTYTTSAKISERLNGIALMYVQQDIVPDIENEIDLSRDK